MSPIYWIAGISWVLAGIIDFGFWNAWCWWKWPRVLQTESRVGKLASLAFSVACGPVSIIGSLAVSDGELFRHGFYLFQKQGPKP